MATARLVRPWERWVLAVSRARYLAALGLLVNFGACSWLNDGAPHAALQTAFITTLESEASIAFVSLGESRANVRRLPWRGTLVSVSPTPARGGLLTVSAISPAEGCTGTRVAEFFDLATQQSRWRAAFRRPCGGLPYSGLDVLEEGVMTPSDGGDTLYVWGGKAGGVPTLSVVTSSDFEVVAADSSWERIQYASALALLPAMPSFPRGALAVVGVRKNDLGEIETAPVRLLDRQTLAELDSIPHAVMPRAQRMYAILPCPKSSRILLVGGSSFVIYDVEARRSVRAADIRAYGSGDLSEGCETVALADAGRDVFRDDDGSGYLFVYRNAMQSLDSVDISTPLGGIPFSQSAIRSEGVVLVAGGRQAWVRVGHNPGRANGLRQRARLLLVDLDSGVIRRNIDLGGESTGGLWGNPP